MSVMQALGLGALFFAIFGLVLYISRPKPNRPSAEIRPSRPVVSAPPPVVQVAQPEPIREIILGESPSQPAIRISPLPDGDFARAKLAPLMKGSLAARISAALQAVPSLLIKNETGARRYMEVIIDGDLVRATSGDGYRAYTMGPQGIKSQAVLKEPKQLNSIVNAAVVWQLASVVVAQKHLADISEKLEQLQSSVADIKDFLNDARRASVIGTHLYLRQAVDAIQAGELPGALRIQLESCERDLLVIQTHLFEEFDKLVGKRIESKELFGTQQLTQDLMQKQSELGRLCEEIGICLQTRSLAWYVFSVFPGEKAMKAARSSDIERSLSKFDKLCDQLESEVQVDVGLIKSNTNTNATLNERRTALTNKAKLVKQQISQAVTEGDEAFRRARSTLLTHDKPMSLVLAVDDGHLSEVRLLEAA